MALVVFVSTQPVFRSAFDVLILNNKQEVFYPDFPDWEKAFKELKKQISGKYALVTSNGVKAAYYIGDYSFGLGSTMMPEEPLEGFGLTSIVI